MGARSILPIVLAGGTGSRLAPLSTPECPKPFLPLPGGGSLLSETLRRVADPALFTPPMLVGSQRHRFALLNHAREATVVPRAILLEPESRNTAMAVASAIAWLIARREAEQCLAILPADHHISPPGAWYAALVQAEAASQARSQLVLLGVVPTGLSPEYGYIQPGEAMEGGTAFRVVRFIEKPSHPETLPVGCWWNSGQFIGTAGCFAALLARYAPTIWHAAQQAVSQAITAWEFTELAAAPYAQAIDEPFDRAVVERAPVLAMPLGAAWQDLGTLAAWEAYTGLPASHWQALPPRTDRPWGYFELISQHPEQVEKRLCLYPGARISLQRHQHRRETWEIRQGKAVVEYHGQTKQLLPGDNITIEPGCWHRLANGGTDKLIIDEIQTGKPDEADIERCADDYGRS